MRKKKAATSYWIQKTHLFRKDEFVCAACGTTAEKPYVICPGCGVSMNGEKYDPTWVDEMETIDTVFFD